MKRGPILAAGGVATAAVVVIGLLLTKGSSAPKPAEVKAPPVSPPSKPCGDNPCLPVPEGIKGLSFGMTKAEAETALGAPLIAGKPLRIAPTKSPESAESSIPLPGSTATVETTLGTEEASCRLDFTKSERLAGILCHVSKGDRSRQQAIYEAVRESLIRQYGWPDKRTGDVARWSSDRSSLVLVYDEGDEGVELENFSTAHLDEIAKTAARAQELVDTAADHARLAEEARRADKKRLAEEAKKALDRDLGSSAERPR